MRCIAGRGMGQGCRYSNCLCRIRAPLLVLLRPVRLVLVSYYTLHVAFAAIPSACTDVSFHARCLSTLPTGVAVIG
jgi:hypothetical protein